MGLVMAALSVPLILRKVPMNRAYGIRTRKAFASESNWFAINAFGGRLFLGLGLFLVVFGYFGGGLAPGPTSPWAPAFLIVPLLGLVPVLVLINAFSRRLPDR
jgi:uncharacterized BrkB/YihY/UPF0761 family membrane protein